LIDRCLYGGCPIFVADRGFASYNVFVHALEKGVYFAIRAKNINTERLPGTARLPDTIDQWADVILTRSNAKKKETSRTGIPVPVHMQGSPFRLYNRLHARIPYETAGCPFSDKRRRV
ncbi:MAG: hypothetical protein K2K74_10850, partial [Lachnospiraceae bacterium]|nr:hypothetical protein [Lachnospiraceae bacterium]